MVCGLPTVSDTTYETPDENQANGRVADVHDRAFTTAFPPGGFPKVSMSEPFLKDDPVITSKTIISDTRSLFFARANVDAIQRQIRTAIHQRTGYTIDRQSDDDLLIIMNWVFHTYAHHTGSDELPRLNGIVMQEVMPMILSNMRQYVGYLNDASTMRQPMERPFFDSVRGEHVPEFESYF